MEYIHHAVAWYQKKIGSYDKQLWEQSVEQKILVKGLHHAPRKSGRIKTEFIDVDLVKGSTFTKAKPQLPWIIITRMTFVRVMFFPLYYRWWTQQTSRSFFMSMLILYLLQSFSVVLLFYYWNAIMSKSSVSVINVVVPYVLMVLLGLIHSQTVVSHVTHKPPVHDSSAKRIERRLKRNCKSSSSIQRNGCLKQRTRSSEKCHKGHKRHKNRDAEGRDSATGSLSSDDLSGEDIMSHSSHKVNSLLSKDNFGNSSNVLPTSSHFTECVDSGLSSYTHSLNDSYHASESNCLDSANMQVVDSIPPSECSLGQDGAAISSNHANFLNRLPPTYIKMSSDPELYVTQRNNPFKFDTKVYKYPNRPTFNFNSNTVNPDNLCDNDASSLLLPKESRTNDIGTQVNNIYCVTSSSGCNISNNKVIQSAKTQEERKNIPISSHATEFSLCHYCDKKPAQYCIDTGHISRDPKKGNPNGLNYICIKETLSGNNSKERSDYATSEYCAPERSFSAFERNEVTHNSKSVNFSNSELRHRKSYTSAMVDYISPCEGQERSPNPTSLNKHKAVSVRIQDLRHESSSERDSETLHFGYRKAGLSSEECEDRMQTDVAITSSSTSSLESNPELSDNEKAYDDETTWSASMTHVMNLLQPIGSSNQVIMGQPDKVSCVIWEGNECKKVDLTALDIGWAIIDKVDKIPESSDYIMIGLFFSFFMSFVPLLYKIYAAQPFADHQKYFKVITAAFSFTCEDWMFSVIDTNGIIQRFFLGLTFFFLLSVADRTFKQRLLYAKHFCYLTSSRRSRKYEMPHFRLNKVCNIKAWLSLRSYLKKRGPQRSVDVIVSSAFMLSIIVLALMCIQLLKDSDKFLENIVNWDLVVWCLALSIYILRYMTLGLKINKKYRNQSVLITEQINLYLQMEQKPHKKEDLIISNNVLKLAEELIKELESPFKISGMSANPLVYNIMKVVLLSAFSAVLTELLGFKLKLYKIKMPGVSS